jgi:hypothetical protein
MDIAVFWNVKPCGVIEGHQHFRKTYNLQVNRDKLKPECRRSDCDARRTVHELNSGLLPLNRPAELLNL